MLGNGAVTRRKFSTAKLDIFYYFVQKIYVYTYLCFVLFNLVLQVFLLQFFTPRFFAILVTYTYPVDSPVRPLQSVLLPSHSFALIYSYPCLDSSSFIEGIVFFFWSFCILFALLSTRILCHLSVRFLETAIIAGSVACHINMRIVV